MIYRANSYYLGLQKREEDTATEEVLEVPAESYIDNDPYAEERNLVVYDDDYNTFEHVIHTLIRVCKHDHVQAEQCTYIIHFTGKCSVKKGGYGLLKLMQEGITQAGISAEVV